MRILVTGDNRELSTRIVADLTGTTLISADVQVVTLEQAVDRLIQFRPDAVVILLSPSAEPALGILHEIRSLLPAQLLAVGPATDPQLILRTLREGACQFIDEAELNGEIPAALKRLSNDAPRQVMQGRLITVLGPSGGSGASTLAANIATTLSGKYERCGLFDLKLETGDLATLLSMNPKHTLADFCRNMERMDQVMFEQCFAVHGSGVRLLAPPAQYADVEEITSRGVRKALSMARSLFPFVVVDLDHSYRDIHAQALHQSDVVLMVMQLDFTSVRQTRRALDHLNEIGVSGDRIRLIVNRYRRPKELLVKDVEKTLGIKIQHLVPDDPRNVNFANNKGVPVVLERPRAKSARSMTQLAHSVNGQLTNQ